MKELFKLTKLLFALAALLMVSKVLGVNTQSDKSESNVLGLDFTNPIDIAHAEMNNNGGGDQSCASGCGCDGSGPDGGAGCCETGCGCGCSSGSGGDCFLTTVVVNRMGEADDGPTLTAMRHLRDEFMLKDSEYAKMIEEYYEIAPPIAKRLETAPMNEIEKLYGRILQTRSEVEQQRYAQAVQIYKQIVDDLKVTVC